MQNEDPPSLRKKAIAGAFFLGGGRFVSRALTLVAQTLILARLLGPEQIGLFAGAMLVLAALDVFSEAGLKQALIQRHGDVRHLLGTAWCVQAVRGLVLTLLILASAPVAAAIFKAPDLTNPLRALSVVPTLGGFMNIGIIFLDRRLQFKRLVLLDLSQAIVQLSVSLGFAYFNPTVWALVGGRIAGACYVLIMSYVIERRVWDLSFHWIYLREMHSYGVWIFVSGLVSFLLVRGGDFVVARLLPMAILGIYQVAYMLATLPGMEVSRIISRITFPAFSQLQYKKERLSSAFLRSFSVIAVFSSLTMALTISQAVDFVSLVLDDEWVGVGPLMQVLAVWGATRALGASSTTLFQSVGRPAVAAIFQMLMLVLLICLLWPLATAFGAVGIAAALSITGVAGQFLRYPLLAKVLNISSALLYVRTMIPTIAAAIAVLLSFVFRDLMIDVPLAIRLLSSSVICVCTFFVAIIILARLIGIDFSGGLIRNLRLPSLSSRIRCHD